MKITKARVQTVRNAVEIGEAIYKGVQLVIKLKAL